MSSNEEIKRLQSKTEQVKDVQRENISRLQDREQKLDDLEERSEGLNVNARHFQRGARAVRRKLWWQNVKLWIILISVIAVIVIVLIVIIVIIACTAGNGTCGRRPS